jgi:hypothetical protein
MQAHLVKLPIAGRTGGCTIFDAPPRGETLKLELNGIKKFEIFLKKSRGVR